VRREVEVLQGVVGASLDFPFPHSERARSETHVIADAGGEELLVRVLKQRPDPPRRSEEHTSELQSLAYLVCRLLLEKKKHNTQQIANYLEALVPTYVKLCQLLLTRPDLLSAPYLDTLSRLQYKVNPFSY